MSSQPGLRERKKQRTREAIARAAHALFTERGYAATTLPEIAEAADVSTRTIFAYFPTKEDILFNDVTQAKDALAQALADRPAGTPALEAVRDFILSAQRTAQRERFFQLRVSKDPTLRSHLRARISEFEEVIAPAIAQDLGTSADDPRPQLVAASLTAAFHLMTERGSTKTRLWTRDEFAAQLEPVFTFLRGGLDALERSRATHPGGQMQAAHRGRA